MLPKKKNHKGPPRTWADLPLSSPPNPAVEKASSCQPAIQYHIPKMGLHLRLAYRNFKAKIKIKNYTTRNSHFSFQDPSRLSFRKYLVNQKKVS
jgi:hypothetical protein